MRAQLGFLRSQPATPQFPSHLMSSQLGFCAGVLPHNPENRAMQKPRKANLRTACQTPLLRHTVTNGKEETIFRGLIFKARLQGSEGYILGKQHARNRTRTIAESAQ